MKYECQKKRSSLLPIITFSMTLLEWKSQYLNCAALVEKPIYHTLYSDNEASQSLIGKKRSSSWDCPIDTHNLKKDGKCMLMWFGAMRWGFNEKEESTGIKRWKEMGQRKGRNRETRSPRSKTITSIQLTTILSYKEQLFILPLLNSSSSLWYSSRNSNRLQSFSGPNSWMFFCFFFQYAASSAKVKSCVPEWVSPAGGRSHRRLISLKLASKSRQIIPAVTLPTILGWFVQRLVITKSSEPSCWQEQFTGSLCLTDPCCQNMKREVQSKVWQVWTEVETSPGAGARTRTSASLHTVGMTFR